MRFKNLPFSVLGGPLNPDGVGENWAQFALWRYVNRFGWPFGLHSWLVGWYGIGQLNHFAIDVNVQVGRELVGTFFAWLSRKRTKSELNLWESNFF